MLQKTKETLINVLFDYLEMQKQLHPQQGSGSTTERAGKERRTGRSPGNQWAGTPPHQPLPLARRPCCSPICAEIRGSIERTADRKDVLAERRQRDVHEEAAGEWAARHSSTRSFQAAIKAKIEEMGIDADDELPDYVMVLAANKKEKPQMKADLQLFLGKHTQPFVEW